MKQKLETALVLVMGLSAGTANAQVCATQPTCESLGFMQKAADCKDKLMMKCPFDTNKVFCGGAGCGDGYVPNAQGGSCLPAPCAGYGATSCNTSIGTCSASDICLSGTTKKYKYTSCKEGWYLSGGNCVINSCSGYGYTSCPSVASSCYSCKSGTNSIKYKIAGCAGDYILSSGSCSSPDQNCRGFSLSKPAYATSFGTCIGENTGKTYYKATSCTTDKICECKREYDAPYLLSGRCECPSCMGVLD